MSSIKRLDPFLRYEGKMDELELDFMTGLLCMDPAKRLTGPQCLKHPYLADLAGGRTAVTKPDL